MKFVLIKSQIITELSFVGACTTRSTSDRILKGFVTSYANFHKLSAIKITLDVRHLSITFTILR